MWFHSMLHVMCYMSTKNLKLHAPIKLKTAIILILTFNINVNVNVNVNVN